MSIKYFRILAIAKKGFQEKTRAFPLSFMVARVIEAAYVCLSGFLIYRFVFNRSVDDRFVSLSGTSDYLSYLIIGVIMYLLAVSMMMNIGRSLITELRQGTIEPLLVSPISMFEYLLGTLIEYLLATAIEISAIIIIGYFLGARFYDISIFPLILSIILCIIAFFCFSIFICFFMLYFRDTYITQNTIGVLISFICGVSFPIEYLPLPIQYLSKIFPLAPAISLFREILINGFNGYSTDFIQNLIHIVVLSIIYGSVGLLVLSKKRREIVEKIFA